RPGRMAAQRLPRARPEAVLWRHVLAAGKQIWAIELPASAAADHKSVGTATRSTHRLIGATPPTFAGTDAAANDERDHSHQCGVTQRRQRTQAGLRSRLWRLRDRPQISVAEPSGASPARRGALSRPGRA